MIYRNISSKIIELSQKFYIIAVTGPRQSGKTTLVRNIFTNYTYVNLEDIEKRNFAKEDPKGFFQIYKSKVIIDEIQYVPELFSYLQINADEQQITGNYVITGSQNFQFVEKISQSLAGRVAVFNLLPFSYSELKETEFNYENYEEYIFKGFYPAIYDRNINPVDWYSNYIQTYLERDIRQLINIGDIYSFHQFLKICANNIGQIVNFTSIGSQIGVSFNTIKKWLSILEASYIIYLLPPFYSNLSKRIVKSPKLYFIDTGLACNLLNINSKDQINFHFLKGELFENMIITELFKRKSHNPQNYEMYFFRDNNKNEIDCIIQYSNNLSCIELKSSRTINESYFSTLQKMNNEIKNIKNSILIYGGNDAQMREKIEVLSWKNIDTLNF